MISKTFYYLTTADVHMSRSMKKEQSDVCPAKTQISLGICLVWSVFTVRLMDS